MAAKTPEREEVTGALPLPIFAFNSVGVVLPLEACGEIGEGDALPLLGIALRLFDLADET